MTYWAILDYWIVLKLAQNPVGVPGLEPGTSASQTQRANQLRYTPLAC